MFTFRFNQWQNDSALGRFTTRYTGRPAWVWGLAMLVAVPFLFLIALLAVAALATAAAVYAALSALHEVIERIGGALGYDGNGRRHVRVRTDPPA